MVGFRLKKEWLEHCVLFLTLTFLLWLGPGSIWEHRIDHGYPYAFNAADAFQHQSRAEGILRIGNYKYEPIEYISGVYPEYPGYYPPLEEQLAAMWAAFRGLETYHTTPALVYLSTIVSAALMYFVTRKFNSIVALLSFPLYLYLFSTPVAMRYFTWGHWPGIFGQLFIFLFVWIISEPNAKGKILLATGVLIGAFMAYTSYVIPIGILLVTAFGILGLKKGRGPIPLLKLGLAAIVVLVVTSRVLVIFINLWLPMTDVQTVLTDWPGGGGAPRFAELGKMGWLILCGMGLGAFTFIQNLLRKSEIAKIIPLFFGLFMFGLGYANTIGFHKRAFFVRLYWPLYLSIFLGLLIYYVGRVVLRGIGGTWSTVLASGTTFFVLIAIAAIIQKPMSGSGSMDPQLWDAITWLRDETPKHTRFVIMYGDGFVGDMFWNLHRHHIMIHNEDYIAALQNSSVKRHYSSSIGTNVFPFWVVPADHHKNNPFFWGWSLNRSMDYLLLRDRDICAYDYILFTKQSYQPVLVQYGLYIANLLLEKPWMTVAFQNDYALILQNNQPGDACIEDQKIQQAE